MNKKIKEKILEALASVLPITAIVLVLSVVLIPIPIGTFLLFLAVSYTHLTLPTIYSV